MEYFLTYLKVFAVGGAICAVGQFIINKTKMTPARILLIFMITGVILEVAGAFEPMKNFAGAGVTVPIMGFGASMANGALKGAAQNGLLGAIKGGLSATSAGIAAVIFFAFIFALFARSRSKKN